MGEASRCVLGLRCSNIDFSFAILEGSRNNPKVVGTGTVKFPQTYTRAQHLGWFRQEIEDMMTRYAISALALKGAEGLARRGKSFVERVENEAAAIIAGVTRGFRKIPRKTKSTIAKDLGLKGKAKYLTTQLDKSAITGFEEFSEKVQDAILVAWSELH